MTRFLTVDQVAQALRRNPELIRRWLRIGVLRGKRIGWSWTVTPAELARFRPRVPARRRRPRL